MVKKESAEKAVRDVRRQTRRQFSAEENIRIVIKRLRGEESIASLCRREGIAANLARMPLPPSPAVSVHCTTAGDSRSSRDSAESRARLPGAVVDRSSNQARNVCG